jgi:tRNA pseudouridine38-40 synthase
VEYNGSAYAGWQIQNNDTSIQSELEKAFSTIIRKPCKIVGAGRTDAGVHARGQGMHIDLPEEVDLKQCEASVNAVLPDDIAVYNFQHVKDSFHARFSATERCYKYYITTRKMPLWGNCSLLITYNIDWLRVKENITFLLGRHDFTAFCASGSGADSKICTVTRANMNTSDCVYIISICANRFMYKMVRSIVGTLIDIGRGKIDTTLDEIIRIKDRDLVGETVSSKGLVLDYVTYKEVE